MPVNSDRQPADHASFNNVLLPDVAPGGSNFVIAKLNVRGQTLWTRSYGAAVGLLRLTAKPV